MIAATTQTTMTALRGCPVLTRETQPEKGRTPSRATAKTSRDAAVIAIAVFYGVSHVQPKESITYQPQRSNGDDIHEDMATLPKHNGVKRDKRLRAAKLEEFLRRRLGNQHHPKHAGVETNRAKQEQDNSRHASDSTSDGTPENPPSSRYRRILGLLSNMTRRIETDQNPSRGKIGQTPVPALGRTGTVVSRQEGFFGRPEPPGIDCPNGEPDEIQEEVQHDHC